MGDERSVDFVSRRGVGRPVHDDRHLFEILTLEGAQAGLSWETILRNASNYRRVFLDFDPHARRPHATRRRSKRSCGIRGSCATARRSNRPSSTRRHSWQFSDEFGSFDAFIWRFTGGKPLRRTRRKREDFPASSPESEAMSAELRKRGFRFVGPTICYAFMQAVGMVNDHLHDVFVALLRFQDRSPPRAPGRHGPPDRRAAAARRYRATAGGR